MREILERRKNELLEVFRTLAPKEGDELGHVLSLIDHYSDNPEKPTFQAQSDKWNDEKYPRPSDVVYAILKAHGGRAKKEDIAREAVEGGWRRGGKMPYIDVRQSIDFLTGRYRPKKYSPLKESDDGMIEFTLEESMHERDSAS